MISVEQFKAGKYEKGIQYQYFMPNLINDRWDWRHPELNVLLEKAALRLGELNSFSRFVPNIDLFIQLHVTKEAVFSSRIEGTQTNINEALLPETEIRPERRNDWKEVNNYINALNTAIGQLHKLPVSGRLLKQAHKILLTSVRGEDKLPGEYRTSQNWIGGATLKDAAFIPPHHDAVANLMADLEHFLHNDEIQLPDLIKIGIAHYQFETIHPFLDGNGRIGRLLISLYLVSKGILDMPLIYPSAFFESNKELYYDNLTRVRTKNEMLQWLKYFLVGIEQTAAQSVNTLQLVLSIKNETEKLIHEHFGKRVNTAMMLLNGLVQNPVASVSDVRSITSLSNKAAYDLIAAFVKHGILEETTGQTRNRIFVFDAYLSAFKK